MISDILYQPGGEADPCAPALDLGGNVGGNCWAATAEGPGWGAAPLAGGGGALLLSSGIGGKSGRDGSSL